MNKYFQIYEYNNNLKDLVKIFQLQGNVKLWWEYLKAIEGVDEQIISWERIQQYFKNKYLTLCFYE